MPELILHHYPESPFAEKARLMLGAKQLSWHSVTIPRVMPKPDLTALTGGYRRTPVLQIGADIYCDTALIARRLDALQPSPLLYPEKQACTVAAFAHWADSLVFQHAAALIFQPHVLRQRFASYPAEVLERFIADRTALFNSGDRRSLSAEQALAQWPGLMQRLEEQLAAQDQPWLFGELSVADLAMAHPLWFLRATEATRPFVDRYPAIRAWFERVLELGHGHSQEMSAQQALDIARATQPAALPAQDELPAGSPALGQNVSVAATDYGSDPVQGELLYLGSESIVIRREDPRAGTVHVHFPRQNYHLQAV